MFHRGAAEASADAHSGKAQKLTRTRVRQNKVFTMGSGCTDVEICDICRRVCCDCAETGSASAVMGLFVVPAVKASLKGGPLFRSLLERRQVALKLRQGGNLAPGRDLENLVCMRTGEVELTIAPIEALA